jgi:hypothetical protein
MPGLEGIVQAWNIGKISLQYRRSIFTIFSRYHEVMRKASRERRGIQPDCLENT